MTSTAKLIAHMIEQARLGDSYTRSVIMERVDRLITLYEKEREDEPI